MLSVGFGTLTVNALPTVGETVANPFPTILTVLTPTPLKVAVVRLVPCNKLKTLVAPLKFNAGLGTSTLNTFPVVGVTTAIPELVIVGVTTTKVLDITPPVISIPLPEV